MLRDLFYELGVWNWFIVAALFALLEALIPDYFLIWYGIAALFVGALASMFDLSWQMQLFLYSIIGAGLLMVSIRFTGANAGKSDKPLLNQRMKRHIGEVYALIDGTRNGRGKLKIGDSQWSVRLESGDDLPAGTNVLITGAKGATLIGKPE